MLRGQAKTDYQRGYMRDYQRKRRGSKQGLNIGSKQGSNTLRRVIKTIEDKKVLTKSAPIFDPYVHKPGDRVQRGKRLIETVIPTLDADGQPIPEF